MPAIELSRLKLQAGRLRDHFSQPPAFIRLFKDLMEFYADRTHRPGLAGSPRPLLHTYNAPPPVLRQVLLEILPLVPDNPEAAAALMDALWGYENLESRLLAVSILGALPVEAKEPVLERLEKWLPQAEESLVDDLFGRGLARLRQEAPEAYLSLARRKLISERVIDRQHGLRALAALVTADSRSDKLPEIFTLILPLTRSTPPALRPYLVRLLTALAKRSPPETAFFLKENLDFPDTPWMARRILPHLPNPQQEKLKQALRSSRRRG
jgi:hypothetical protein